MPGPRQRSTQRGFTLIELVLMLAIVAIVSSLIVPLAAAVLRDADRARAEADVQQLATALTRFYADLKRLPTCGGEDCSRIGVAGGDRLRFLAVGGGDGDLSSSYPAESPALATRWDLRENGLSPGARANAFNHLVRNDPNADGVVDALDYPRTRPSWQGPYLQSLGPDPWGHSYLLAVGALRAGGLSGARPLAWILSAGPNGLLETAPDAVLLGGDDIGVIFADGRERGDARVRPVPAH